MRRLFATLVAVLLCVSSPAAQTDKTDEFITTQMKEQRIPGLAVAVLKDGKIAKMQGYGVADVQLKTPVTPDTVFKIGSVSKQFIATGVMLLVEAGRLRLDDRVGTRLTDAPPSWSGITIRHLLTHTSGLMREAPGFDPFKIQSDADVIRSAYSSPLVFAPGEKWQYSNLGYFALAEIIRVVSGRPWGDYIGENVFKPAGMTITRTTTTTEQVPNRASGYTDNDNPRLAPDWPAVRPSGAFLSTVRDLAKWDAVLYADTVLSDATRRQMWAPVVLNSGASHGYGFGWSLGAVKGRRTVYHGGGLPGFVAQFVRFIDDRLTVIVLMNQDDADDESIALGVAALYLPASVPATP